MEENRQFVEIEIEDGTTVEAEVLCGFEACEQRYIALVVDGEEEDERDVVIYRCVDEDGQAVLEAIETEEEYDAAAEVLEEMLDDWMSEEE